ncbi:MAG: peptide deformylase [Rhodobacteraceae bacterium]|jgi:peptide deformylase|nr:peptide deformylase [Paracoccaceae bacterium]|tara:strand:- start:884 stop:1402 length:519 start_codon:yes stop_codon:yes gene_type:complete
MAVKKILLYPDPLLLMRSAKINIFDKNLVNLSKDLIDTMYDADGVGLAAPQIGINKRIFVMDCSSENEEKDCRVVINPEIEHASEELGSYKEGCLSIPGITEEISRPKVIKVLYQDVNGVLQRDTYDDLWSICFQHELDHLNGKLFIDHLRPMKKILVKNKMKKSSKKKKQE